jgi:uncharacterized membrane protein
MNAGHVGISIAFISLLFGLVAGTTIKTRPWRSILARGLLIAIVVFTVTAIGGFVPDNSAEGISPGFWVASYGFRCLWRLAFWQSA